MQPTESRQRNNVVTTRRRRRRNPTTGSVLPKSEMGPVFVVIADVLIQQPSQMSPIQHDHMIQEISTYAANPALRNSVLPRTSECSPNRLAAHRLHVRDNIGTELCVPIEDQESLRLFAAFPSFVQLQPHPKGVGITSHVVMKDSTTVVADHKKAVQNAEGQCRHSKKIHRRNGLAMVPQKSQPALRGVRRSRGSPNPSRNRRFRQIEAQLKQLTVNARRSPGWIFGNHLEDQGSNFLAHRLAPSPRLGSLKPFPIKPA